MERQPRLQSEAGGREVVAPPAGSALPETDVAKAPSGVEEARDREVRRRAYANGGEKGGRQALAGRSP